jgi:hypothetical protein
MLAPASELREPLIALDDERVVRCIAPTVSNGQSLPLARAG